MEYDEQVDKVITNLDKLGCKSLLLTKIVADMLSEIVNAQPWKRIRIKTEDWYDYTCSIKSTFPEWSKFYFTRNKYRANQYKKWLVEKWMWGTKKKMINIFEKFLSCKRLTDKQKSVLKTSLKWYFEEKIYEFVRYNEDYFVSLIWNGEFVYEEVWINTEYDKNWNFVGISTKFDIYDIN